MQREHAPPERRTGRFGQEIETSGGKAQKQNGDIPVRREAIEEGFHGSCSGTKPGFPARSFSAAAFHDSTALL
ncbi:MAG TPA: hypothetical protein PLB55_15070 [Prosthecobacter sp.]|nr:hypothetical protein [Prosthecobacter sp.]